MSQLNLGSDHLSRIESGDESGNLDDSLADAQLFVIAMFNDHYRDIIQFFAYGLCIILIYHCTEEIFSCVTYRFLVDRWIII